MTGSFAPLDTIDDDVMGVTRPLWFRQDVMLAALLMQGPATRPAP
jgi:hypothetical protein